MQLRESTQYMKLSNQKRYLPFFGEKPINEITPQMVRKWHNQLIQDGYSKGYIHKLHAELSAVFNHAIRFYNLQKNPARITGTPKIPNAKPHDMDFWTLEEFQKAVSVISDQEIKTKLLTLYWTGMRKGELYALRWCKIDFQSHMITIDESYRRQRGKDLFSPTKTGTQRTIKIPSLLVETLKAWKATQYQPTQNTLVFHYHDNELRKAITEAVSITGVKRIRVHDLRHSHASYLIHNGFNVVLISKRLGHEKTSTTLDIYSHFFPTAEEDLIQQMDKDFDTNLILKK